MFNASRAETNVHAESFVPHLRRMTDADPGQVLELYPHHQLPKLNQLRTAVPPPVQRFALSSHIGQLPTPVIRGLAPTQLACSSQYLDPVCRLPRDKAAHQQRLHLIRNRFEQYRGHRSYKRRMRQLQRTDVELNMVCEYAEELERDPDEWFRAEGAAYDWYCTGNTMAVVGGGDGGEQPALVYVEARNGVLNRLKLARLTTIPAPHPTASASIQLTACPHFDHITAALQPGGHIYELQYSAQPCSPPRLCVRQKHRCTVLDLSGSARILATFKSDVPYVSASFASSDSTQLVCVTVERQLSVHTLSDTSESAPPLHSARLHTNYQLETSNDRWCTVRPFGAHVHAVADRETVRLFDVRMPFDGPEQPLYGHRFRSYIGRCERVTCMEAPSAWDTALAVATSHKLFVVDVRMAQVDGEVVFGDGRSDVLQWTHQLTAVPTMMATMTEAAAERGALVAVGAQVPGQVRLCETQRAAAVGSTARFVSQAMPYRTPNLFDSYQLVRRAGECLDARCLVPQQLQASTTALCLWQTQQPAAAAAAECAGDANDCSDGQQITFLLQQNSAGNIFSQVITDRDTAPSETARISADERTRIRKAFCTWDEQLQRLNADEVAVAIAEADADSDDECNADAADGRSAGQFYATDITYFRAMADVVAHNLCNPFGVGASGMVDIPAVIPAGTAATRDADDDVLDDDDADDDDAVAADEADKTKRPVARWRKPVHQLRQYADVLTPALLEIWQMPETTAAEAGSNDRAEVGQKGSGGRTKADRIAAWLERSSTQQTQQRQVVDVELEDIPHKQPVDLFDVSLSTIGLATQTQQMTQNMQQTADVDEKATGNIEQMDIASEDDDPKKPKMLADDSRANRLEMTLDDAATLWNETMATQTQQQQSARKKRAKKVRKFVPGF